jgi:1,4-dihydroxy-2-naphthoyl-CoA hydrolase
VKTDGTGRGVSRYVGVAIHETGDWEHGVIVLEGACDPGSHVATSASRIGSGALFTMCDNVAGFCGGLAALPDGWVQTVNLMVRRTRLDVVGPVRFVSTVLREGRRAIVTEVTVHDAQGVIAFGTLTSAVLQPAGGPPSWSRPARLDGRVEAAEPLPPFAEWLGLRETRDGAELDVFDELRNPWGIVHGGVTASLIDAAAVRAARGDGEPNPLAAVVDATVHYLAPSRVGPLSARGEVLGARRGSTLVRVEVRDDGADRTTAVAVTTVRG